MFDYLLIPQPWLRVFHMGLFGGALLGSAYVHWLTWDLFRPLGAVRLRRVLLTHRAMAIILALIWVSGAVLIWLARPTVDYLAIPKVQIKLVMVLVVTVNAYLLGRYVVHRMHQRFALGKEPWRYQVRAVILGCISIVSWTMPGLLGVAREWNARAQFWELFVLYLILLVGATLGGIAFHIGHYWYVQKNQQELDTRPMEFQPPEQPRADPGTEPVPPRRSQEEGQHRRVQPVHGFDPGAVEAERRRLAYTK